MIAQMLRIVSSGLLLAMGISASEAAPYPDSQPQERAVIECQGIVTDLAFSPDSKLLAVVEANVGRNRVRLWDVASAKIALMLPHRDVLRVQFSPDGKMVATAGKHIKLWEVASGKELAAFKFQSARWMLFSADGKRLAAIGGKTITILNVETKEEECWYDIDRSRILVSAYPSLKKPVYAVKQDKGGSITLMDPFTNKEVVTCENDCQQASDFASDREEKILVGFCRDARDRRRVEIRFWDRKSGKKIAAVESPMAGRAPFALSPDGKILALNGVHFYEMPSGRLLASKELSCLYIGNKDSDGVHVLAFSPDGRTLAIASAAVHLWSLPEAWRKKK